MLVRFQQQFRRLQTSLMQSRRIDGKVRSEHIAALGSVIHEPPEPMPVRERIAFWSALPPRLAKLDNRVSPDQHAKIYAALHARIPMVTPDEQRTVQEENAKGDESFWDIMRDITVGRIEDTKTLIATAERQIAEMTPAAAQASERVATSRDRIERLRRGDSVAGGLGKPVNVEKMLRAGGWTTGKINRAVELSRLTEAELKTLFANRKIVDRMLDAHDRDFHREARKMLAARKVPDA